MAGDSWAVDLGASGGACSDDAHHSSQADEDGEPGDGGHSQTQIGNEVERCTSRVHRPATNKVLKSGLSD